MVLPLPVDGFERSLLLDDHPAYPNGSFIRVHLRGRLHRDTLLEASRLALARHPLLKARVARDGSRLTWVPDTADDRPVRWVEGPTRGEYPSATHIDLSTGPGWRMVAVEDGERTDLVSQFHQACTDGMGGFRFLEDLVIFYCNLAAGRPRDEGLRPLDPSLIANRWALGLDARKALLVLPLQLAGTRWLLEFLTREATPLVPVRPAPLDLPAPARFPAVASATFEPHELTALKTAARRLRVSVYELFVRDTFIALAEWRRRRGLGDERDLLRLGVPIDLRFPRSTAHLLPAMNRMSVLLLDRRSGACGSSGELLHSIKEQFRFVARYHLELEFVTLMSLAMNVPYVPEMVARLPRCLVTHALSFMGRAGDQVPLPRDERGLFRVGSAVVEGCDGIGALRPYQCGVTSIGQYAGRLFFATHYDPRSLALEEGQDLMQSILTRLRLSAGLLPAK